MTLLLKLKENLNKNLKMLSFHKSFEFYYNKGIDFYNKKQYEKAITCFKQAILQSNVQPQVYYNLGLSHQYMKNYDNAIVSYNKFLEKQPNDYDGLYNLALTYYTIENFSKAIELFEKCIAIKKDEDIVKTLTIAYLAGNEVQKAMDLGDEVFQIPIEGIKLYYTIAKAFENKNSLNKDFTYLDIAIGMYSKIIQADSGNFDSYISISICYAKKGEWENSVEFCKKALEKNPNSYEANNQMGLVYYCYNEIDEAVKYYEIALKLKPKGDYKIYSNLAYAYEKKGDTKKAIKLFSQLVSKFPQYPAKNEIKNHLRILKAK